jgi:hypothetical protein
MLLVSFLRRSMCLAIEGSCRWKYGLQYTRMFFKGTLEDRFKNNCDSSGESRTKFQAFKVRSSDLKEF